MNKTTKYGDPAVEFEITLADIANISHLQLLTDSNSQDREYEEYGANSCFIISDEVFYSPHTVAEIRQLMMLYQSEWYAAQIGILILAHSLPGPHAVAIHCLV